MQLACLLFCLIVELNLLGNRNQNVNFFTPFNLLSRVQKRMEGRVAFHGFDSNGR